MGIMNVCAVMCGQIATTQAWREVLGVTQVQVQRRSLYRGLSSSDQVGYCQDGRILTESGVVQIGGLLCERVGHILLIRMRGVFV